MSELSLTLLRLGFLVALWMFVFSALGTMRRDLGTEARPVRPQRVKVQRERRRKGAELVVHYANGEQRRLPLESVEITFGRAEDNSIVLDDDFTSAHHAVVRPAERGWQVEDRGSTNGTWVDRRRITAPMQVRSGMKIRIGRTEVEVRT